MTPRADDRLLWLSEAASMSGVSAAELRRAVGRGDLDAVCPSGDKRAIRLRLSDLSKWIARVADGGGR
jgi:hypothetical protein